MLIRGNANHQWQVAIAIVMGRLKGLVTTCGSHQLNGLHRVMFLRRFYGQPFRGEARRRSKPRAVASYAQSRRAGLNSSLPSSGRRGSKWSESVHWDLHNGDSLAAALVTPASPYAELAYKNERPSPTPFAPRHSACGDFSKSCFFGMQMGSTYFYHVGASSSSSVHEHVHLVK